MPQQRHKGTFTAESTTGTRYTIQVWVDAPDGSAGDNPGREGEEPISLRTEDGQAVKRLAKGPPRETPRESSGDSEVVGLAWATP